MHASLPALLLQMQAAEGSTASAGGPRSELNQPLQEIRRDGE